MLKTKEEIINWLEKYKIENYTINDDLVVDVATNVFLYQNLLFEIPLQFGIIDGDFEISHNKLTSLKGCPHTVYGDFNARNNKLINLENAPQYISGDVSLCKNNLSSFENSSLKEVFGSFDISFNRLKSLKGMPLVKKNVIVSNNELTSLIGSPFSVTGIFNCSNNFIESLECFPRTLETFIGTNNKIRKLNIQDLYLLGKLDLSNNPIEEIFHLPMAELGFKFSHETIRVKEFKNLYNEKGEVILSYNDLSKLKLNKNLHQTLIKKAEIKKIKV